MLAAVADRKCPRALQPEELLKVGGVSDDSGAVVAGWTGDGTGKDWHSVLPDSADTARWSFETALSTFARCSTQFSDASKYWKSSQPNL